MAIDVLKGFGRLKLVVQGATVAIGAWSMIFDSPYTSLTLETAGPDDTWHGTDKDCDIGTDAVEWLDKVPPSVGQKISSIKLCFRASKFPDGQALIPYAVSTEHGPWEDYAEGVRLDAKGWAYLGDTPYSQNVQPYTEHRTREFTFTPQMEKSSLAWAEKEAHRRREENILSIIVIVAAIVAILEIFSRIIGWIVRGFIKSNDSVDRFAKWR